MISSEQHEQRITELTRRKLRDGIALGGYYWAGHLNDVEFLGRLYKLDELNSTDTRFQTAAHDIFQHRVNNYDWPDDWIYYDDRFELSVGLDKVILNFLVEMLHPLVRVDVDQVAALLHLFNEALAPDGYVLYEQDSISGHPIYGWKSSEGFHKSNANHLIESRPLLTDPRVLQEHLKRVRDGLQNDPAQTISSCKELLESLCKIILTGSEIVYSNADDLPSLYRKVAELLQLNAESVTGNAKASHTSQRILRTLSTTVQSLAELRNELGLGHGRANLSASFNRHARLSFNATVTVTEFLLDTWQDRVDRGELVPPTRGAVMNPQPPNKKY